MLCRRLHKSTEKKTDVKFYHFPLGKTAEASQRLHKWIVVANRKDWQLNEGTWICSEHFISGMQLLWRCIVTYQMNPWRNSGHHIAVSSVQNFMWTVEHKKGGSSAKCVPVRAMKTALEGKLHVDFFVIFAIKIALTWVATIHVHNAVQFTELDV